MVRVRTRQCGFITTELIVGTALLGVALTGLAVSLRGFSLFNHYEWSRQQCVAAAEAQLDSLAATGQPMDQAQFARLWPELEVSIDRMAGQGPWESLELVRVTAAAQGDTRKARVRLERYMRRDDR